MTADEMTLEEFRALAKSDPKEFVERYLKHFCLEPSDVNEIRELDEDIHGMTCEKIYSEGGYEGAGEHAEVVFAIIDGGKPIVHFRCTGFYMSYDGTNWEDGDFDIVFPEEVLVTQFLTAEEREKLRRPFGKSAKSL